MGIIIKATAKTYNAHITNASRFTRLKKRVLAGVGVCCFSWVMVVASKKFQGS